MASENLIKIALRLAKSLGANEQKFLGTRSNVSFLGSGPQDGMLFQKSIDPEMISVIGQEKIIPAIESSMSYATGGKLNDLQINKLIDNMTVMKETFNPTNILKGDFGIDSLRAKSGIGERQLSEAAGDVKSIDDAAAGVNQANEAAAFPSFNTAENIDTSSPLMSKLESRIGGMRDETEAASAIMKTIPKVDLPGKRASAREFLVNALKNENPNQTSFADIIDPADIKYIMEGGGGVEADPIVLIQKYFGPRVAELMPVGATTEQMAILTKRILETATDAKGLRPTDPDFDKFTLKLQESVKETPDGFPFAEGGIARLGLRFGGSSKILKQISNKMIKKAADDIYPTGDYKYDAEMVVESLVENNPKLFKNMLADDLDDALRSDLYGLAVRETGLRVGAKIKARRAGNAPLTETITEAVRPQFQLNVEKAVSELNIPRAEAIRIAQLPSDQQKLALQKYMDRDFSQRITLGDYNPKTFDAARGGLAKILEV
jgi:hypothetical protein